MRGGAAVARRAHNPKVASSNLAPATIITHRPVVFLATGRFFCGMQQKREADR